MRLADDTLAQMYASQDPALRQLAIQGGYVPAQAQNYSPDAAAPAPPPAPPPGGSDLRNPGLTASNDSTSVSAWGMPISQVAPSSLPIQNKVAQVADWATTPVDASGRPIPPTPAAPPAPKEPEKVSPADVVNAPAPERRQPSATWGGGPFQVLPAHAVSLVSPGIRAGIEQGLGAEQGVAKEQGEAEQKVAEEQAKGADREAAQAALQHVEVRAERREREDLLRKHLAEIDELTRKASSEREDPDQIFRGPKGTGNRAMAAIAMALGEFGKGLTHQRGESAASKIINDTIDRNIAAQRAGIQQDYKAAEAAKWGLAEKLKSFRDPVAAEAAERDALAHQYAAMARAEALRSGSPLLKARADKLSADVLLEGAKARSGLESWVQAQRIGGAGYGLSDVKPEEVITLPDGRHVTVPEKDREEVLKAARGGTNAQEAGSSIQKLLQVPVTQRGLGWVRDFDASVDNLALAEVYAGGKGGKGTIELLKSAVGKRLATLAPGDQEAVNKIVKGAVARASSAVQNSAQYEVQPVRFMTPQGVEQRKFRIVNEFQRKPEGRAPDYNVTPAGREAEK